jgi:hypothetical protein
MQQVLLETFACNPELSQAYPNIALTYRHCSHSPQCVHGLSGPGWGLHVLEKFPSVIREFITMLGPSGCGNH